MKVLKCGYIRRSEDRPESRKSQGFQELRACWKSGALILAGAVALIAITSCGSDGGAIDGNSLTADTEIYLANQSDQERGCLEETFNRDGEGDELSDVLQSWAGFILDDSPGAIAKLDGTAGLWACGIDEFSTLRAMARSVFPSVPQGEAPGGLSEVPLPTSRPAYFAVIDRLPNTLDGAKLEDGSNQTVIYLDDAGDRRFVIEAGDFSDPEYGGEWTSADGLISRLLSPYFVGSELAIDHGLLWLRFSAPENDSETARTIHAINFGEAEASIWFQALAFTPQDADLLAKTFAEAAGGG